MKSKLVIILAIGAVVSTAYAGKPSSSTSTTTAQAVMAKLTTSGSFAVNATETYKYNEVTAAACFNNAWDGNAPTTSASGGGARYVTSADILAHQPTAPAPLLTPLNGNSDLSVKGVVQDNDQNFLYGDPLTGGTYPQSVSVAWSVWTGSRWASVTVVYTFTYNVDPKQPSYPAMTNWDLVNTNTNGATIEIHGFVAGESVMVSKQYASGKYSFSLVDGTGNRVTGLSVAITDATGATVQTSPTASNVSYPTDFTMVDQNMKYGTASSYLKFDDARTILNTDSFTGNDNGGADGSALAVAVMDPVQFTTTTGGDYKFVLTGTVKGNGLDTTSISQSFTVTSSVHIILIGPH